MSHVLNTTTNTSTTLRSCGTDFCLLTLKCCLSAPLACTHLTQCAQHKGRKSWQKCVTTWEEGWIIRPTCKCLRGLLLLWTSCCTNQPRHYSSRHFLVLWKNENVKIIVKKIFYIILWQDCRDSNRELTSAKHIPALPFSFKKLYWTALVFFHPGITRVVML